MYFWTNHEAWGCVMKGIQKQLKINLGHIL